MSRAVMQQALDALVLASSYCDTYDVIDALREALALPEQEPVENVAADAYEHACDEMERWQAERYEAGKQMGTTGSLCDGIAWLYGYIDELEAELAQPAKPLGNATLMELMPRAIPEEYDGSLFEFARAIEAAHGIKD